MKKNILLFLALVPVVTGYLLNITLLIPGLGALLYYLLPSITLCFWFYLGSKYSETNWNILQSVIIGNGIGLLSLLLYFWQFWQCSDDNRNLIISGISQLFVSNTNLLTAGYAILFEPEKNVVTQISSTAMQIMGLVLMVIIFTAGYIFGKVKNKQRTKYEAGQ